MTWEQILKEAEKEGFIVEAGGGVAFLMTHEEQKENNLYEHVQYQCGLGKHPKAIAREKANPLDMYIPDPIERMESRIENQIDLVDAEGNYPCCYCGKKIPVGDLITVSPHPDAPGMCFDCADAENERNACKA